MAGASEMEKSESCVPNLPLKHEFVEKMESHLPKSILGDCSPRRKLESEFSIGNDDPPTQPIDFKTCSSCGEFLPRARFYACRRLKTGVSSRCTKCETARKRRVLERKAKLVAEAKRARFHRCTHCLEQFAPDALFFVSNFRKGMSRFEFADATTLRVNRLPDELNFGHFLCSPCWTTSHIQQFMINLAASDAA